MLSAAHRLRRSPDFQHVVRSGVRAGRQAVVVHAAVRSDQIDAVAQPRVGFVVSKAIGNAVMRNRVKRRLRSMVRVEIPTSPPETDWVVRALPPAANCAELEEQLHSAWLGCLKRLAA